MLGVFLMLTAVIVIIWALGISVYFVCTQHNRLQSDADHCALQAANSLNSNDRLGQMNNLIADNRQLLFKSRSSLVQIQGMEPQLTELAEILLQESRDATETVENSRKALISIVVVESRGQMQRALELGGCSGPSAMAGSGSSKATIVGLQLGYLQGWQSNVEKPSGNPELLDYDTKAGYIDPATNCYRGNIVLTLQEDRDKDFHIAALAPPVLGFVSQSRVVGLPAFEKRAEIIRAGVAMKACPEQLPSAVKISLGMPLRTNVIVKTEEVAVADSAAASRGASQPY
jgi:hypothetical protein